MRGHRRPQNGLIDPVSVKAALDQTGSGWFWGISLLGHGVVKNPVKKNPARYGCIWFGVIRPCHPKMFKPEGFGGYVKPLKKDGHYGVRGVELMHQKNGKPYQVTMVW